MTAIIHAHESAVDHQAVKVKQQAAWSSGDYAVVGTTLQIVGERLCEALDLSAGTIVLDVAAGNGNATLAAGRRFARVTSTDYVPALLEKGQARAKAENLKVDFVTADVEDLPFPDGQFDCVLSTFGAMFAPDHRRSASEMLRVVRSGGRIGLANWTPDGFIGQLFKVLGSHVKPPAGVQSPSLWGTSQHLVSLFGGAKVEVTPQTFVFRYMSAQHFVDVFRTWYGPVHKAFNALDPAGQSALEADIRALISRLNTAKDGKMCVPSDYLEVIVTKA